MSKFFVYKFCFLFNCQMLFSLVRTFVMVFRVHLDCKEIQPVHPKGDQSWMFIGRTDVEAETPVLWPPHAKIWLIGKYPDAGKDWRQEEKGMIEEEMVGWHHQWWTWVWESSGSWLLTGKPGMLQSMEWQRAGHHWAIELNWRKWEEESISRKLGQSKVLNNKRKLVKLKPEKRQLNLAISILPWEKLDVLWCKW